MSGLAQAIEQAIEIRLEMERTKRREEIAQLHREHAELRDELLVLSNRIEAVTRAQVGSGLHSVKVTPRRVTRYCFECEHPRQFTEGKCDYCAAPLQQGAEAR